MSKGAHRGTCFLSKPSAIFALWDLGCRCSVHISALTYVQVYTRTYSIHTLITVPDIQIFPEPRDNSSDGVGAEKRPGLLPQRMSLVRLGQRLLLAGGAYVEDGGSGMEVMEEQSEE